MFFFTKIDQKPCFEQFFPYNDIFGSLINPLMHEEFRKITKKDRYLLELHTLIKAEIFAVRGRPTHQSTRN